MTVQIRIHILLSMLLLSGAAPTLAQSSPARTVATAQSLPQWFTAAADRTPVYLEARAALSVQQSQLSQLQNDSLATPLERKAAASALTLAEVGLVKARLSARKALMQDYFAWLESRDLLTLATSANAIAQDILKAAQARFKSGAINAIDQAKAENDARTAAQALQDARTALTNAELLVKTRFGRLPEDQLPVRDFKPGLPLLEAALPQHPQWLAATTALSKAETELALKNNEFSAPVDINAAKNTAAGAQRAVQDAQQTVRATLKLAWDTVGRSKNVIAAQNQALTVARSEYSGQKLRFDKGLIPRLILQQSQLAVQRAQVAVTAAQHLYVLAAFDLALAANVDFQK